MAVSMEEEARYLSEVDVLEPLSREELDELARRVPDVNLAKGEFLHSPKERGEGIWLLKKGRVRVYRVDPGGGEFTLEVVREGTVFGEMTLGPRRLRAAHALAIEPSLVGFLDRERLEDLIRRNPEVGIRLVRVLSERLRLCHERMADFADKDVPARLASLIVYLVESEGVSTGEGYEIPTRYTHEQLGTMIGAGRVAVSRAFAGLREAGAVEQRRRLIHVVDMEALERAARVER
jgi:CRP/FNR family cyclic AMP-dependent transcriptional regulator